jgi:hypothetical protein
MLHNVKPRYARRDDSVVGLIDPARVAAAMAELRHNRQAATPPNCAAVAPVTPRRQAPAAVTPLAAPARAAAPLSIRELARLEFNRDPAAAHRAGIETGEQYATFAADFDRRVAAGTVRVLGS